LIFEDEGISILWIFGNHSPIDTTLHSRRFESSTTPFWKPHLAYTCTWWLLQNQLYNAILRLHTKTRPPFCQLATTTYC